MDFERLYQFWLLKNDPVRMVIYFGFSLNLIISHKLVWTGLSYMFSLIFFD